MTYTLGMNFWYFYNLHNFLFLLSDHSEKNLLRKHDTNIIYLFIFFKIFKDSIGFPVYLRLNRKVFYFYLAWKSYLKCKFMSAIHSCKR